MPTKTKTKKKLTKAMMRVRIAKDVLAQLASGEIVARHGTYLRVASTPRDDWPIDALVREKNGDVQAALKALQKPCEACAIGAVFVAAVKRYDGLRVPAAGLSYARLDMWTYPGTSGDPAHDKLHDFFSETALRGMENAFETQGACSTYSDAFVMLTADARLRAIMRNVIMNDGTFRGSQL